MRGTTRGTSYLCVRHEQRVSKKRALPLGRFDLSALPREFCSH
jgi:hypothetical protein